MKSSSTLKTDLLKNKVYSRVYTAYAAATLGDWFDSLAIMALAVYKWQSSPLMLALIPVAFALPGVLLGSISGVVADRFNKLRLMRLCDLLTALLTVVILFAPGMTWLLPLLTLRSALSTFSVPAQQALTRSIVREDQLLQATSLNGLVGQGSKIAGPLLGGTALLVLSPQWCILVNAMARLASYLLLLSVRNTGDTKAQATDEAARPIRFRTMWREGWSYLLGNRLLLSMMVYSLAGMVAILVVDYQFTSLFRALAPEKTYLLGYFIAATGIAAVLIMLVMGKMNRQSGYGLKLGGAYILIGVSLAGVALLQPGVSVVPVLILGLVLGLGNGIFIVTFNYSLQKETPPHMTGRIFGIQNTLLGVVQIGAPLLGGALVQASGPSRIFLVVGLIVMAIGTGGLLLGRLLWPAEETDRVHEDHAELPG
ncbi:MFS transporter [Paenibacillus caui]|uniref:MFS transporter n=1 Tax=Paenibacillus caui TaxID=2873927 RepID=UPI001CA89991|nr:MFS transporter [Paenibacillus caui]